MISGKGVYATGGLIGAVLASTCCIAPFVLLVLGVSGAWISHLTALAPYQPVFLLASLGFLAAGFWKVYRKSPMSCEAGVSCPKPQSDKVVKIALWMATLLIVIALSVEWIGPVFL